jgi:putative membrane protein
MLAIYAFARICLLLDGRIPWIFIVVLHVVPPALFALAHGAVLYRVQGIAVFAAACLGTGALAEGLSLRTGFPFGNYYFTDLMGPQLFHLPILLALAYLGIGYVSWILAVLILGDEEPLRGGRLFALPLLASCIMLAWDIAMDPVWALLARAWVWRDGGAYFGVPLSNFAGWFGTAFIYYLIFAVWCRFNPRPAAPSANRFWLPAILLYAVCAVGNLVLFKEPATPPVVTDPTGKQWLSADVLRACAFASLLIMSPFYLLAWTLNWTRSRRRI